MSAASTNTGSTSVKTLAMTWSEKRCETISTRAATTMAKAAALNAVRRCGRSCSASCVTVTVSRPRSRGVSRMCGTASTVCDLSPPCPEPSPSCRSRMAPGRSTFWHRATIASTPGRAVSKIAPFHPTIR